MGPACSGRQARNNQKCVGQLNFVRHSVMRTVINKEFTCQPYGHEIDLQFLPEVQVHLLSTGSEEAKRWRVELSGSRTLHE